MHKHRYAIKLRSIKQRSSHIRRKEIKENLGNTIRYGDYFEKKGKQVKVTSEWSHLRARGSDQASRRLTHRQKLNMIPKEKKQTQKHGGSEHWKYRGMMLPQGSRDLDFDVDTIVNQVTKSKLQFKWQYDFNGTWMDFLPESSTRVEAAYRIYRNNSQEKNATTNAQGPEWQYLIDFRTMRQTNIQHTNKTSRNIRRVSA